MPLPPLFQHTLKPLLYSFSSSSCWALGTVWLPLSASLVHSCQDWSGRRWPWGNWEATGPVPVTGESKTRPEGGHGPSVGQQRVTSVLPPTPLYHYILLFLKWSYKLKYAFLITSVTWCHSLWQAVLPLWRKLRVCFSTGDKDSAVPLSRTLPENDLLSR